MEEEYKKYIDKLKKSFKGFGEENVKRLIYSVSAIGDKEKAKEYINQLVKAAKAIRQYPVDEEVKKYIKLENWVKAGGNKLSKKEAEEYIKSVLKALKDLTKK